MKDSLSIYVHWPWCLKKCPYCDFNSHVNNDDLHEAYINTLISDIKNQKELTGERSITSVFFGGGTPSLMKTEQIERILATIDNVYSLNKNTEITLECNPTSSNITKFQDFKQAGINRISVGVQSINDNHLKFLGREHSANEALNTINAACSTFKNVSFDLIYGLPNQKLNEWENQLRVALDFEIKHLSAYQLTVEKNTKFFSDVKNNLWQPMNDDLQADFFDCTHSHLTAHNFNHYEVSNFSLDGYNCKHNYNIWKYNDYIGIGAGAHGRYKNKTNQTIMTTNFKMPNTYINSVKHVKHGFYQHNHLDESTIWQEKIIMGLRIQDGVPRSLLDQNRKVKQALEKYFTLGLLHNYRDNIALTKSGFLHLDTILADIIFEIDDF